MPVTDPDGIWYTQAGDIYSAESISALEASSVQAALNVMRVPETSTNVVTPTEFWSMENQSFTRIDRTVYWYMVVKRTGGDIPVNGWGWLDSGNSAGGATIGYLDPAWIPPREASLGGGAGSPVGRPVTGGAILPDGRVHARYVNGTAPVTTGMNVALGGVYTLV